MDERDPPLGPTALSRATGVPVETIKNVFKERSRNPGRQVIAALAEFFEVDSRWLRGEIEDRGGAITTPAFLPILHKVAAGVWREHEDDPQTNFGEGPAPPPDAYAGFPQWWEIVEGESINQIYPSGALLRVIDAIALRYMPRVGDIVVIERRREGQAERTVKLVKVAGPGRVVVSGSSTNKRWNTPIDVSDGLIDGDEAEIVGLVAGAYIQRR